MKTLKEKIEVMQAALDGEEVQFLGADGIWTSFIEKSPVWAWDAFEYRIKPKPMELMIDVFIGMNNGQDRYEVASDSNRELRGIGDKVIKMIEVME